MIPLSRIGLIHLAYLVACMAAATTITLIFYLGLFVEETASFQWWDIVDLNSMLFLSALFGVSIFFTAALPAALTIMYGETASKRSLLYYVLCGVIASVLPGAGLLVNVFLTSNISSALTTLGLVGAAGFVGGLTYWLLAGRDAGTWRPISPPN